MSRPRLTSAAPRPLLVARLEAALARHDVEERLDIGDRYAEMLEWIARDLDPDGVLEHSMETPSCVATVPPWCGPPGGSRLE